MNQEDEITCVQAEILYIPCYYCEKLITLDEWYDGDSGLCYECRIEGNEEWTWSHSDEAYYGGCE